MDCIQEDDPPLSSSQTEASCTTSPISLRRLSNEDTVTVKKLHHDWFPIKYVRHLHAADLAIVQQIRNNHHDTAL